MSNPRERVIKKLNKQFPNLIGSEIPINQPIKSHQTRFAAAGGVSLVLHIFGVFECHIRPIGY